MLPGSDHGDIQQKEKKEKQKSLNLITHVDVESAHNSYANALIPAIESTEQQNWKAKELTVDSLYGSDDNFGQEKNGVELIAPTMGSTEESKLKLSDFQISDKGQVLAWPQGHAQAKVKKKKRNSIGFDLQYSQQCSNLSSCPVKKGKKFYYIRFTEEEMRIAKRRAFEQYDDFKEHYRWQAGVEATMSGYNRRTSVKHLRVRGIKVVRFCATLKALAVNIFRATAVRMTEMMPEESLCGV